MELFTTNFRLQEQSIFSAPDCVVCIDNSCASIPWLVDLASTYVVERSLNWLTSLGHDHKSEPIHALSFVLGIDSSRALIPYFK
jgi:hypothetical protein